MAFREILRPEVQTFIKSHTGENLAALMLKKSPFEDLTMRELVVQIKGREVALKKYPFLLEPGIVFPQHLSLEQSSSMATALYKSEGHTGSRFVDLTCGLGIDAFFLSRGFEFVELVEQNLELNALVKHNWEVLGREATFYPMDLHRFLAVSEGSYDLIYLDPARRDKNKNKVFLLEDLSPNLLEIQSSLLAKSKKILIKLSPLLDLEYLKSCLKNLTRIEVVAVKNEVKEVLVHLEAGVSTNEIEYKAVNLESEESVFTFKDSEREVNVSYSEPLEYLYIPNNAILKSGAFSLIAARYGLKKLAPNTHLYTAHEANLDFPGRVLNVRPVQPSKLAKNSQFNIISKNYPLKPHELKSKYKLKDGGEHYLIFTESIKGKIVLKSI